MKNLYSPGMKVNKNCRVSMKEKVLWCIRQLVPHWNQTKYFENDKHYATWWKMFFGRCYKQEVFEIK